MKRGIVFGLAFILLAFLISFSFAFTFISASGLLTSSSPNCAIFPGQSTCNVKISWTNPDTSKAAFVTVKKDSGSESLFACNAAGGSQDASWIVASSNYTFKLYSLAGASCSNPSNLVSSTSKTLLDTLQVKGFNFSQTTQANYALISDTHICQVSSGNYCNGASSYGVSGSGNIVNVVSKINSHSPSVTKTIIDGDITHYGDSLAFNYPSIDSGNKQYTVAKSYLDSLANGYYILPGNHDSFYTNKFFSSDFNQGFRSIFGLTSDYYSINVSDKLQFVFLSCIGNWNSDNSILSVTCSQNELNFLSDSLNNGKQTIVFSHYPILQVPGNPSHESVQFTNAAAIKSILTSHQNFLLWVNGHDGCERGIYYESEGIKQYMTSHKGCNNWCGSCSVISSSDSQAIPTISYIKVYNEGVIINQQCDFTGCTSPSDIILGYNIPAASTLTCVYNYSSWTVCNSSALQSRVITSSLPYGCIGGLPENLTRQCSAPCTSSNWAQNITPTDCPLNEIQTKSYYKVGNCNETIGIGKPSNTNISCDSSILTCLSFNYSNWSNCSASGVQTRVIFQQSPENCSGGSSLLVQNCSYTPNLVVNNTVLNPVIPEQTDENKTISNNFKPLKLILNTSNSVKSFFIRIICKLSHFFNSDSYRSCVADYLG